MSAWSASRRLFETQRTHSPGTADKYLFIVCMNNSGSTLLERLLRDCRNVIGFPTQTGPDEQVNGQRFVADLMPTPGKMAVPCRRIWSEQAAVLTDETRYNWPAIKTRWRREWARNPKFQTTASRVLLEKSPADVYRAQMLQKYFEPSFFVLIQRNPYAVAEGIRRRTGISLTRGVQHWVRCAERQIENEKMLMRSVRMSYEQLSENSEACRQQLARFLPELDDLDMSKEVAVQSMEGQVRQPIVNYNGKQIAQLSIDDMIEINAVLSGATDVMTYFGYDFIRR